VRRLARGAKREAGRETERAAEMATIELLHQSSANVAESGCFMGFRRAETLKPGSVIDRYGSEGVATSRRMGVHSSGGVFRRAPPELRIGGYEVLRDLPAGAASWTPSLAQDWESSTSRL
jgi:hypothetical protein